MDIDFPTVSWDGRRVTFRRATAASPLALDAPAALVFAFHEGRVVLADIQGRGWCVPSGRIEAGESTETAARREAWEEAAIVLDQLIPFGATVEILDERTDRILAVAFVTNVGRFAKFVPTAESRGMRLATRQELPDCYYLWDPLTEAVFDAAWGLSHSPEVGGQRAHSG